MQKWNKLEPTWSSLRVMLKPFSSLSRSMAPSWKHNRATMSRLLTFEVFIRKCYIPIIYTVNGSHKPIREQDQFHFNVFEVASAF